MGLLDSVLNRFGYVRSASRRGYDAAQVNRLTSSWPTTNRSADAELRYSLKTLRARSRNLAMNNDYAKKFVNMCVTNVVGPSGITFQNKAKDPSGKLDTDANTKIELAFAEWTKKENASVCGRLSWKEIQRLAIRTAARDGETYIRIVRGAENKFRFALQFIEADCIDEELNKELPNGNRIKMGVEVNQWGKPVAYHILSKHPGDYSFAGATGNRHERVPASEMIQLLIIERPDQTRGVPWMHTAMSRLNMLGGYEEAELVAARVAASKMGFFRTQEGFEGNSGNPSTTDEAGEMQMEAEPGTFEQLPAGLDFVPWDPTHPAGNFSFFLKAMLRGVASGLGVAYNSLASDLESISYSSIRAGSIEERDSWKVLQGWMIDNFCQEVFTAWLEMAMLTVLNLPVSKFDKFNRPAWKVRGWQWVDPLKDVKANVEAVNNGIATRTQILAEQGLDIEEVFEELRFEKTLAAEYGLVFDDGTSAPDYQAALDSAKKEG